MSSVTNVILTIPLYNDKEKLKIVKKINSFFEEEKGFVLVDNENLPIGWYGGTKMLEAEILIGAFNYLNIEELIKHLRSIDWKDDHTTPQLMFRGQDDNCFTMIDLIEAKKT
jgi:hypothetical protein